MGKNKSPRRQIKLYIMMPTKPPRNSYFYISWCLQNHRETPISIYSICLRGDLFFPIQWFFGMMGDNAKGDVKTFVDNHKTAPNHFFNLFHHSMGNIEWGKISRLFRLKRRLIFPHPLNWLLLFETAIQTFFGVSMFKF